MNSRTTNPLVTIVTASYMKFDKIYETIKSVINQDYKNIEYIIADDGSTNFPKKDIVDYINKMSPYMNYKIYHSDTNRGTVKNVNYAFKNSKGDYVFPLSCGDVFFSRDVVSKIVERFNATNGKLIVTSRLFYEGDFKPICMLPHYIDGRCYTKKLDTNTKQYGAYVGRLKSAMASGSAMYYSRDILNEIGYFDERYVLLEDAPFLIKYLNKYPLTFAYDIISIWYEHGGISHGAPTKNNTMVSDNQLFDDTDRFLHIDKIKGVKNRRYAYFLRALLKCETPLQKMKVVFSFPFSALRYVYYNKIRRKLVPHLDNIIVRREKIIGDNAQI